MVDDKVVHGAKDGGERPTIESLRHRLRAEFEGAKDAGQRPRKAWLKQRAKPDSKRPAPTAEKPATQPVSASETDPSRNTETADTARQTADPAPAKRPPWRRPWTSRTTPTQKRPRRWFQRKPKKPISPEPPEKKAALKPPLKTQSDLPGQLHKLVSLLAIFKEGLTLPKPIILASVISSILGLALPLAVLQIYDRILPNQTVETLALLTIGLFVAFALDATLKILRSYLLGWNAVRSGFNVQLTAITRLLKAQHAKVEGEPPAIWVDGLEAVRELSAFEGGQSRLLTLDIPLAGIFLLVLGLVGGLLILVPIFLIVAFGSLAVMQGRRLKTVLTNRSEQDNRKHDFLVEVLTGIHTVKGLAMEPMILRRFERLQKSSAIASYETILLGNQLQSLGNLFANLMMISVVTVGALMVMSGNLSIGGLACCSLLSGRLTQPVSRGIGMWTEFQNIQLAQERAQKFDTLEKMGSATTPDSVEITGALSLDEVEYKYEGGQKRQVFRNISLHVSPGEFVGIKGEDGSGRSTLVKLITGELKPTSGRVIIGGLESCPSAEHLQIRDVAYVSANSATFNGTILENIAMFRSGSAIECAQRAAKLIGLENDIHQLPEGYDTQLAQGVAHALSSGFLQRIAIARALAGNPKILVFDEANTMLDLRSDLALRKGLEALKGQMTAVLISNRPSFLSVADRTYALTGGSLVPIDMAQQDTSASSTAAPAQGSAA